MEEVTTHKIEGLLSFCPKTFEDNRGNFFEAFNQDLFNEFVGRNVSFVQDNQSVSKKNVLRGLHFQCPPHAQGKLVRVIAGKALDVAVDLRKKSSTYGQYVAVELTAENNIVFWLPEGFAHGFVALEEQTIFSYKCTNYYNKTSEDCLMWNDTDLNIDWKIKQPIISDKDKEGKAFLNYHSPF